MVNPRIQIPDGKAPLQQADDLAPALRNSLKEMRRLTLDATSLSVEEIEVIRVRSAELNGCRTCLSYRTGRDDPQRAGASAQRMDDDFYAAITGEGAPGALTDRETIARELTTRWVQDHFALDADEAFWQFVKRHYDDAGLVELALTIASFSMSARFNHVLGLDEICEIDWPGKTQARLIDGRVGAQI